MTWTDITADTIAEDGLTIDYGFDGTGPLSVLAGTGVCTFTLQNWNPTGKYSPGHASCTAGWALGVWIRVVFVPETGPDLVKFIGKVQFLDIEAGAYGRKRVAVIAHDAMGDLTRATVRNITAQVNQTDVALLQAVYAAVPATSLPVATSFDTAIDTYPYAFGDVSAGQSAAKLLQDVLISAMGLLVQHGDGTHVYINRHARTYTASVATLTVDDLLAPDGFEHPHDLMRLYNRVIVTIPQIEIGSSVEVLAAETTTDSEGLAASETRELFLSYRDPLHTAASTVPIGGTDFETPVAGTDYVFNGAADGSGVDYTASVVVSATFWAGSVMFSITNNAPVRVYRITLQVRGIAIRRLTPIEVESTSTQAWGQRTLTIETPFQDSRTVARYMANYLRGQYEVSTNRPISITIKPQDSDRLMRHALMREPGDRITLSESVTATACDAIIYAVHLTVSAGGWIACSWDLAPQSAFMFISPFRWGMVGSAEWGESTVWA